MTVRASGINTSAPTGAAMPVQQPTVPAQQYTAPAPTGGGTNSFAAMPATSLGGTPGTGAAQAVMYNGMTAPQGEIGAGGGFGSFANMPASSLSTAQAPMFQANPMQQQSAMLNSVLAGTASQFMATPNAAGGAGGAVQQAMQSMGSLSPGLAGGFQPGFTTGSAVGNVMGGGYTPGQYGASAGSLLPLMSSPTAMDASGGVAGIGGILNDMHNGASVGSELFGMSTSIINKAMQDSMQGLNSAGGNPLMGLMGGGAVGGGMPMSGVAMKGDVDGVTAEGGLKYATDNSPTFTKILQMAEQNVGGNIQFQITDLIGNQQGEAKLGGEGAGGNIIKLDTNSESSAVDFLSTIIHEVIHIALGGDGAGGNAEDSHGPEFTKIFNDIINEIDASTGSNGQFRQDWVNDGANGHAV